MSMLNFYINRAGRNLPEPRRQMLERAKAELRASFAAEAEHSARMMESSRNETITRRAGCPLTGGSPAPKILR